MKIVMLGTAYPMRGGIAQFNAILARGLAARHEVEFLSFRRQYPGLLFPGKTQYVTSEDEASAVRIDARPMLDSINPLSWWRTARYAADQRPDLVLLKYWLPFMAPCFGTVTRWIKRRTSARVIYVCDNVIPHERRPFDLPLTRYALAPGDGFVVMSAAVRDDLLRVRPDAEWRLVHHPIYDVFGTRTAKSAARATLGLPAGPLALFFGYVRPYKGLDLLLRALPIIREQIPLQILVAGEFYEGEARYRRLAAELGIADAVRFDADYIPQERVATYFSAADAVVLPYRTATQSGIIQVAYHLDTPVICTDVGGLGEIVRDGRTGLLVPPDDPAALARAVVRYYAEELEEPLRAGVAVAKRDYSWEPLIAAVEELAGAAGAPTGGGPSMQELIAARIREGIRVKERLQEDAELLAKMATVVVDCIRGGGKVVFFGNGGSAADAQHLAAELSGRFYLDRPALPAISLSTNSSALTAIGNDYGFEHVFARQLPGVGARGDVIVAISTSGNSPNVLEAVRLAKQLGMITFGWTGRDGGALAEMVDFALRIDSDESPRIQEAHILAGHILCEIVEARLFTT